MKRFKHYVRRLFQFDSKGSIGIGSMIIFIAMILVAGIAASIVIQTMNSLQQQAMRTGEQTTAEVATGLAVYDIVGHVNTTSSRIDKIGIMVRPRAGSMDIDLSTTVLELSDESNKFILTYDSTNYAAAPAATGVFSTAAFATLTADDFGIIELEDADGSCAAATPVINRGDKVLITVNSSTTFGSGGIASRIDIGGRTVPEEGAPGIIAFRTPSYLTDEVYKLL